MKPEARSPAHQSGHLAELVCSNSLRGASLTSAVGLLKEELTLADSLLMEVARRTAVPAGRALAVDRTLFSLAIEEEIGGHAKIEIVRDTCVTDLPEGRVIVATGPLTGGGLADSLIESGAILSYHDAIAPVVEADSIDMDVVFEASRYEQEEGEGDYLNCPMDEAQYYRFVELLVTGEKTALRDFEHAPFFEGCLPVEEIAVRGPLTLAHGPLKPVGLFDPRTKKRPFAVVQLRTEDREKSAYNLVGFQTRLTRPEQKRIFAMIPGLENARFARLGQVHRNTFVNAPSVLDEQLRLKQRPEVTLAGQVAGVEGYVESIACGLLAGLFVSTELDGEVMTPPPPTTALGGLLRYLQVPRGNFQPSNVIWMMIEKTPRQRRQKKRAHREANAKKALQDFEGWFQSHVGARHASP